ncbi:unnamed protein product, partial [Prorocentrum cordatum]
GAIKQEHTQAIPDFIFTLPMYQKLFDLLVAHSNGVSTSPTLARRSLRSNMAEAARLTRNRLLQLPGGVRGQIPVEAHPLVFRSVSRAVWRQGKTLAAALVALDPHAQHVIKIENDVVKLCDELVSIRIPDATDIAKSPQAMLRPYNLTGCQSSLISLWTAPRWSPTRGGLHLPSRAGHDSFFQPLLRCNELLDARALRRQVPIDFPIVL